MAENKDVKKEENAEVDKINLKEERIRKICLLYYSRPDIRKAMFEFSKHRECVPRYFEGFGKRPDAFQFDSDVLELAKKGATSFHCSEEIWQDPLELSTDNKPEDIKNNRIGWDLLIDVDSKYLDYSKIYGEILVEVLHNHGIKNIGVKFSGSKGLHIIVPFKAFPKEISGKKTAEMFPEWPRLICHYLNSKISEKLKDRVIDLHETSEETSKMLELYCVKCNNNPTKKTRITFLCPRCKTKMQNLTDTFARKRKIRCPNCQVEMEELETKELLFCENCNVFSDKNPENFKERVQSKHIDADLVLVSPRHLFRMPYSLHEKTSLASVVIDADKIKDFQPEQADPMKITPRNFLPNSQENEAKILLSSALEFKPPQEEKKEYKQSDNLGKKQFNDITITNLTPDLYPPTIKKILEGLKTDGRKRALFILLSFFKSLKLSDEQIQSEIEAWNSKNTEPLPPTYIKGQLMWYAKQKEAKLPPNFDKHYYKDIGFAPSADELATKNPVSYVIKKYFWKFGK